MKSTALYDKMKLAGFGYRKCATQIRKQLKSNIHFTDVYNFVHHKFSSLGKNRKKIIRDFFIIKGWISKPKPRKAPCCRRCGLKYPSRKNVVRSNQHTAKTGGRIDH
jgi:hypothetical protein